MSTPRGKRGFFYETWANGGKHWTRILATVEGCTRIAPEVLEEERTDMGEAWYRQEYLCEFVQADDAVFREEDVDACLSDDVPELEVDE